MMKINGDLCHDNLIVNTKQELAFDQKKPLDEQKELLKSMFRELTGYNVIALNACKQNLIIESDEIEDDYRLIRFVFESEKDCFVPCYLLIPNTGKEKYPVVITLQGHKKGGMYNSIGIVKHAEDEAYQPRGAFALQAVQNGYAALCVELRGMGELHPSEGPRSWGGTCAYTGLTGLLLGRTLVGERAWDISHAIDILSNFKELDLNKIAITGNSGGGTASFYAACMDERIKISAPSCSFCPYLESIFNVYHCTCNYIPKAYQWFDMQDLAALIAPRKLIIIAGQEDGIFRIDGVRRGFETVMKIYEKAGVIDNCRLVETPKGHYWCEDIVWPAINQAMSEI